MQGKTQTNRTDPGPADSSFNIFKPHVSEEAINGGRLIVQGDEVQLSFNKADVMKVKDRFPRCTTDPVLYSSERAAEREDTIHFLYI